MYHDETPTNPSVAPNFHLLVVAQMSSLVFFYLDKATCFDLISDSAATAMVMRPLEPTAVTLDRAPGTGCLPETTLAPRMTIK